MSNEGGFQGISPHTFKQISIKQLKMCRRNFYEITLIDIGACFLKCEPINLSLHHPVMSRLFSNGVSGLFEYAQELGYKSEPSGYVSKCDLCFSIRKYLITYDRQTHPDLTPGKYYMQDF